MRVFINPGHAPGGDPDPGAVGPTGLWECDVAAEVASRTAMYLSAAGCETRVLQHDDLGIIVDTANEWGADLFVSIHCNSCDKQKAAGVETYSAYGSGNGSRMAACIQRQLAELPGAVDRGPKKANFYVVRYTEAPAVLVELDFISNPTVEQAMQTSAWQDAQAAAVARGVTDYWQQLGGA